MTQDERKSQVAHAALQHVVPGQLVGVGTGSTVDHFIDALAGIKDTFPGVVSSSNKSTERLRAHGIAVFDAGHVQGLPVYVDGADEIDQRGHMIKGGGAALTQEKIVADLAACFVCIADESKLVDWLGRFALPVEVIAMAAPQIVRRFAALGATASLRPGVTTDNGHPLLDVSGLRITDPVALEAQINQWPGVVTVGLFALRRASLCLLGTAQGVRTLVF